MLPPFTKPAGREPLRAFRPAKDELKPEPPRKDPHEQQTLRPFAKPDLALAQSFRMLSSNDGEKKIEGMMFIRRLAQYHSVVLGSRLHDVCIVLIQEVRNLHSRVSRTAVVSLRELYSSLQKGMDQEVEATAKVLLHKAVASNAFIRQDVDTALESMVQNCTPIRSMNALLAGGLCHQNAAVRKCTARHLATLVEKIGAGRLLSGAKNVTARIIPAVSKLAQDSSQETRFVLGSEREFYKAYSVSPDSNLLLILLVSYSDTLKSANAAKL
ncbi:TOG array regulator of axonemal microtubules protein 1-like isoform X2 [Brachyhypopomus gauderio]|uniref:TOG array regulator of axonemal microtubules protein 1-like isoform X2 n=1 Tax=Brachyhypopomus gauderio TaxID=698409 RepID=UPI0040412346